MRTSVSNTSGQQQIGATHFRLFSRSVSQAYLSHSTTAECSTPSAENPIARPPAPAKSSMDLSGIVTDLSLIHISEPTRRTPISSAVFCLKKKQPTALPTDTPNTPRSSTNRHPAKKRDH